MSIQHFLSEETQLSLGIPKTCRDTRKNTKKRLQPLQNKENRRKSIRGLSHNHNNSLYLHYKDARCFDVNVK